MNCFLESYGGDRSINTEDSVADPGELRFCRVISTTVQFSPALPHEPVAERGKILMNITTAKSYQSE